LVRHPSYTGILMGYCGLMLLVGNWWYLLCIGLAMLGGLIFRITAEEKA
jgi:protein-S-isoprenylcysteine O-methyltransferase Ste14